MDYPSFHDDEPVNEREGDLLGKVGCQFVDRTQASTRVRAPDSNKGLQDLARTKGLQDPTSVFGYRIERRTRILES